MDCIRFVNLLKKSSKLNKAAIKILKKKMNKRIKKNKSSKNFITSKNYIKKNISKYNEYKTKTKKNETA